MRHLLLGILGLSFGASVEAQEWVDAGLPNETFILYHLYLDDANNTLYACGHSSYPLGGLNDVGLCRYSDGIWECLGVFNAFIRTAVVHGDTLIAAGAFTEVDGFPIERVAAYYGGGWHPFGDFAGYVSRLKLIDNEVWALGEFEAVDGDTAFSALAKRVAGAWSPMPPIPEMSASAPLAFDAVYYRDTLYVSGNFSLPGGLNDIVRLVNGNFEPVPGALYGGFTSGGEMVVYQDELYLGGGILEYEGNAGHGLIRFDGSEWKPVGGSLQDAGNGTASFVMSWDLTLHDDKLWVCGGFYYAGHAPATGIANWDGERWCNVGSNLLQEGVYALEFFNDTLFIAHEGFTIAGDTINCLAKWNAGPIFSDSCSATVGVAEVIAAQPASLHPNPLSTTALLHLPSDLSRPNALVWHDAFGRLVRTDAPYWQGNTLLIERGGLPPGLYHLRYGAAPAQALRVLVH